MTQSQHILSLTLDELAAQLEHAGMPKFRAKQIFEWIFQKRVSDFTQMTNLSLADRTMLAERYYVFSSEVVRTHKSDDGTEKHLFKWADGGLTETVMIPCDDDQCDEYGNTIVSHRRTVCLSTQVGCPVRCAFCASGLEGLKGNLTSGQIVEEALRVLYALPAERRISNVVFMGMGEPLANLANTTKTITTLMAPWGFHISGRKITVSTVGLPPQMKQLADLNLPITLAISLHAPNDTLRRQIIPWAEKISIDQIVEAGQYYFEKTGRELTLEYIILDGVNNLPEHARELAQISRRLRANVNLIYYNEVPELPFKRPTGQVMFSFQNILRSNHVNAHIRKSRGREIAAACGQLARQDRDQPVQVTINK